MKRFIKMSLAATAATYFLIFIGGLVRVSGAGLGCPDWPTCFGRWFPPTDVSQLPAEIDPASFNFVLAWIEYINRLVGMIVGLLIAATAVWALLAYRKYPRLVVASCAAALITAYQGWQGGQLVASELESLLVSVHMGLAFIIASLMIYTTQQASFIDHGFVNKTDGNRRLVQWLGLLFIITIVQVVTGTQVRTALEYVAEAYPLLPASQWFDKVGAINVAHTIIGFATIIICWQIGARILRSGGGQARLNQTTWWMIVLGSLEVLLGVLMSIVGAPPILQLFHLLTASLFVGTLVLLFSALRRGGD